MQLSPLQLKQHFLTKVAVDQRDKRISQPTFGPCEFENVPVIVNLEHGVAADESDDPRHFMLRLGLRFDEKNEVNVPYDISIELIGFFEVAPSIQKEKRRALVLANGAAILYSAAREAITTITGRFSKGVVTLPSVNFVDDAEKMEEALKAKAKPASKEARAKESAREPVKPK